MKEESLVRLVLALLLMATPALADAGVDAANRYFEEFEVCKGEGYSDTNEHCIAMKAAMEEAKAAGCKPIGTGIDFRFERSDMTVCE